MPKKKYDLPKGLQNKPVGSENWYQIFYRKDRRPTIKWVRLNAHDLAGAKIERERLLRTYELGLFDPWEPKEEVVPKKDPTFREVVAAYLKTQTGLAKNTRRGRRACLNTFMERTVGGRRRLSQVTESDIERFIERPGIKESTRDKRASQLAAFYSWCIEEGYCEDNPARTYRKKRNKGLSKYVRQQQAGKTRAALMPDDLFLILSEVQAKRTHLYLIDTFLFALATGLRLSELTHLNRRDVYLDEPPAGLTDPVSGRIRVRCWTHPQTGKRFTTKNGKDRTVPLCPLAARIAAQGLAAYETEDVWKPVFRAVRGGRLDKNHLSYTFKKYRDAAGFGGRVTFHSLRHSFASWLMMLGVNLFSIKRLLGHASLDELDTYAELCEDYLLGDARSIQRQMLTVLCPDLPDIIVDRILPERRSLLAALSDDRFGRVQSLRAIIPMEDVLFSGIVYEIEMPEAERNDNQALNLLEVF